MTSERSANRLAGETSPYLLQHAHNPVDWYPWGGEAFTAARRDGKPILLSIGYSACHWCHVMERESFEDAETARLMNELFVNVKVDREERPDLDEIYMSCVQMMTGHGGWPMTVFLTAQGEPFYGGTYFPPSDRHGLPGFRRVLRAVAEAYHGRPNEVRQTASRLLAALRRGDSSTASDGPLDGALVERAAERLSAAHDGRFGGLGRAPKFPNTIVFSLFLRAFRRSGRKALLDVTTHTLRKMAEGGIYDHLGGGFHRYSVDERWLVPHFEKMLYDNAQLARLYLDAYRASGDGFFLAVAEDILRYVSREMRSPDGGFYSTQDADSEGAEGKFFVWERSEVLRLLGEEDGEIFCRVYDVSDVGNFEGANILHLTLSDEQAARMFGREPAEIRDRLARGRRRLFEAREARVKPFRDEKILAAWNGWMISAYAQAHRDTAKAEYREIAERAARFVTEQLGPAERLLHGTKDGEAKVPAFLDDVAALGIAFLDLFETTFDAAHLDRAERLGRRLIDDFWDEGAGGFFFTGPAHERLIARTKPVHDGSVPSGNSMATELCLRLHAFTEDERYLDKGERALRLHLQGMQDDPFAHANLLAALDFHAGRPEEIVIVARGGASGARTLLDPLGRHYQPNQVLVCYDPQSPPARLPPFARDKPLVDSRPTAYVCHRNTCSPPLTDWPSLRDRLEEAA
ncbi:MAG: thioredoxin domain-containing protein [Deltaproteobacteria bacterium]|nr:thioredoxin domain-containing protein [Deltaproteobacteria bacterium]